MSGSVPPGMMWNPVWVSGVSGQVDPYATSAVYTVPDEPMFIPDPNWGATGGPQDQSLQPPAPPPLDFSNDAGGGGGGMGGGFPDGMSPSASPYSDGGDDGLPADDDLPDDGDDSDPRQKGSKGQGGRPGGGSPQRGKSPARPISGGNRLGGSNGQDAGGYGSLLGGGMQATDPANTIKPLGTSKASTGTGAGYGGLGAADNFWGASYGGADYEEPSLQWPGQWPQDSFLQPFQAYFKQLPVFH